MRTAYRRVWCAVVGAAGAVGLVVGVALAPIPLLVFLTVLAFAALVGQEIIAQMDDRVVTRAGRTRCVILCVLPVVAVVGFFQLTGVAGLPLAAGLALSGAPLLVGVPPRAETTGQLCARWVATAEQLRQARGDSAAVADLVRVRQRCLDELERRDPAGVARWISAGDTLDPGPYLTK